MDAISVHTASPSAEQHYSHFVPTPPALSFSFCVGSGTGAPETAGQTGPGAMSLSRGQKSETTTREKRPQKGPFCERAIRSLRPNDKSQLAMAMSHWQPASKAQRFAFRARNSSCWTWSVPRFFQGKALLPAEFAQWPRLPPPGRAWRRRSRRRRTLRARWRESRLGSRRCRYLRAADQRGREIPA